MPDLFSPLLLALFSAFGVGVSDFMSRVNTRFFTPIMLALVITISGLFWAWLGGLIFFPEQVIFSKNIFLWIAGIFNAIGLTLLYVGVRRGPLSAILPAASLSPAFSALMWYFAGYPFSMEVVMGILLSVCGVSIIGLGGSEKGQNRKNLLGTIGIGIAAALVLALRMFLIQTQTDKVGIVEIMITIRLSGAATLLAILFMSQPNRERGSLQLVAFVGIIIQSFFETAGVSAVFAASKGDFKTVAPALFSCSVLITIIMARVFLGEKINRTRFLGISTAISGAFILSIFTKH